MKRSRHILKRDREVEKLLKKPNKPINSSTYIIKPEDAEKWLVFEQNCIVTVPSGLAVEDIFEGEAATGATATFVAGENAPLRHADSISKTLSQNSPFGIRNYMLYGTDPVNYLNQ